ncbi:MAG TPA: RICIN domain-containing protein [Candidatus Eisenbacteria bacterium]
MTPPRKGHARRIGRVAGLLVALLVLGAVPARPAQAQTDCFAVNRELRELEAALGALHAELGKAPPAAKAEIQRRIDETEAKRSAKADEAAACWYAIHVHAVRVSDSCPGERAAAIDTAQVARWIGKANEVFRAARIRLEFDPTPGKADWAELPSTEVNDLVADLPGDETWERGKAIGDEIAARYPRKALLLFRHGPDAAPTGGGFSSTTYDFVALPGYETTTLCGADQNAYLLAHELAHYFGLKHTFRQFKTKAAAAEALRRAGNNPKAFDGDALSDTPPEPYIEELQCAADSIVILNGVPFALLRDNVMSYYRGDTKTLTPQQASIMRAWVERRFADAMDRRGPYVPDERRKYQILSSESGRAIEVDPATKENGARLRLSDWSGGASQAWRIVPLVAQDAGAFEIVSVATGKCLTVDEGSMADGAKLVSWDWLGSDNQKWRFIQDESGEIRIEAKHSGKALAAPAASRASGEPIEQSVDQGGERQRWRLLPAD